jgi:replicative DNA helicase Mcm
MSASELIIQHLKKIPNNSCSWSIIYNLLLEYGYSKPRISNAKRELLESNKIVEEKDPSGKKIIKLVNQVSHEELELFQLKDKISQYIKQTYNPSDLKDEIIAIDLSEMYQYGLIDVVEKIAQNPQEYVSILRECFIDVMNTLYDLEVDNVITIKNIPKIFNEAKTIGDIKSKCVGKLVEFEGIINMATNIKSALKVGVYRCNECGKEKTIHYSNIFQTVVPKCCNNSKMELIDNASVYVDVQELKVQQPLDTMDSHEPPKSIPVIYENTPGVYSGRVRITGIPLRKEKNRRDTKAYDIYIKALHVEVLKETRDIELSEEDIEKIERISKDKDVINKLSNALFPEILGHEHIKKSIFLQQIKGNILEDERGNIHILLITDPAVGKTVMLRKIGNMPGNEYASLITSTGVGLTASVSKEEISLDSNNWVVKPGVLVRASGGTACIDEINVPGKTQHLAEVHDAMENQFVKINKAGVNALLPTKCALLCACNPKYGRFDPHLSVLEQINMPPQFISRFDLIFAIKDVEDTAKDKDIGLHIVRRRKNKIRNKQNYISINGVEITEDILLKYISYASNRIVDLDEDVEEYISNFYAKMRSKKKGLKITARQLESITRLSEAVAKTKLKDKVEIEDVDEAIKLIIESLKETSANQEGEIDIDKLLTGISSKERSNIHKMKSIIQKLEEVADSNGLVYEEDILNEAELNGIDRAEGERILKKLKEYGDIVEVRHMWYKLET